MSMPTGTVHETSIPVVHTFLRDLNILLKSARMYGVKHVRTIAQSKKGWESLQAALTAGGKTALQIAASQNRLFVNNAPLKSGPIESSFAQMLMAGDLASITFRPNVTEEIFNRMVHIFSEAGTRPRGLAEKMKAGLGSGPDAGIRIDEVRFVQADPARSGNESVANLLVQTLGSSLVGPQVRLSQPMELLRMLTVTDPAPMRTGTFVAEEFAAPAEITEEEVAAVIRLLSRLAQSGASDEPIDTEQVQKEFTGLSDKGRENLRRIITDLSSAESGKRFDRPLLLQVAENLAIRLAIEKYGRGDTRIDAVTELLHRMNGEIESLRGALGAAIDSPNGANAATPPHADELEQEFWNQTSPSDRIHVLLSDEAWRVPPHHIREYLEELRDRNDGAMMEKVLLNYVNCIHNPFPEARSAVAHGLGELSGPLSSSVSHSLRFAIREVGEQLIHEEDPDLRSLLTDTFSALAEESISCGRYRAAFQVLSALDSLEKSDPDLAKQLRAKFNLNPRIPDFIEEALRAPEIPEELTDLLRYVSRVAVEHIASRLSRCGRRRERERLVNLAKGLSPEAMAVLRDAFRVRPPSGATKVVGLLSRLDPEGLEKLLPVRLPEWNRIYQDVVIQQISSACAEARGRLMAALIHSVDPLLVPEVIDEIGMGADQNQSLLLLRIANKEIPTMRTPLIRIKAIEGVGRLRSPAAIPYLKHVISAIGPEGQKFPREFQIAAAQSLRKIDPQQANSLLAAAGIVSDDLQPIPCDPIREMPGSRQRYYARMRLLRPQPARITTAEGEFSAPVVQISLGGGLCVTEKEFAPGTAATIKVRIGVRAFAARVILRAAKDSEIAYEIVDIDPEDRGRLRSFLQGLRR